MITTTNIMILINIIIFVMILFGKIDIERKGFSYLNVIYGKRYFTLITSVFYHKDWVLFLCNMYALYFLGNAVEYEASGYNMLAVYFVSALLGGFISCIIRRSRNLYPVVNIGATSAICGLLGTYIVLSIKNTGEENIIFLLSSAVLLILLGFTPKVDKIYHFSSMGVGLIIGLSLIM